MKKKTYLIIISAVAGIAFLGLAWWLYVIISTPIQFEKETAERKAAVIERLELIRTAERQYKLQHKHFTDNFDTLINFALNGKIQYETKRADENDAEAMEKAKAEWASKPENRGKVFQNIEIKEYSVRDSIFKHLSVEQIKEMRYVPFTDNKTQFELEVAEIMAGSVTLPVVECRVLYKNFLDTVKYRQEVINFITDLQKAKKYPGLKFGDLTKGNNEAGNWGD